MGHSRRCQTGPHVHPCPQHPNNSDRKFKALLAVVMCQHRTFRRVGEPGQSGCGPAATYNKANDTQATSRSKWHAALLTA
jgi:hypothetical protein